MKLLRNREIIHTLAIYISVSLVACVWAFLSNIYFGIFTLTLCLIFIFILLISTYKRYQKLSDLSMNINRILHSDSIILPDKYAEGELAILGSEIYKMTVRLREQSQQLKEDKIYLADSLADISHQIRTPLTSINLILSFLSEPYITNDRRITLTREIYELLSRIDWLITSLLKISKLDAETVEFKKETVSLSSLIEKSVSTLLIPIELKNQQLSIAAEGNFYGDTSWTVEAITNILKNCMEHTQENGKLEITAKENVLYSEIIITDNGKGINEDDLPHIFERFYKGQNSDFKSFGIGLALSRMIITKQNGTVKAENNTLGGAKFTIKFYKGVV